MLAAAGAGAYLAGIGLNAWGQNRAMNAMRDVWGDALARNQGFDNQLNERQQQALAEINPNSVLGLDQATAMNGQMDASARNALAAIQAQAGRRKGNAEGKAVARQRQQGTLAQLLRSGKMQATLAGLQQGGQNTQQVGQRLGIDSRMIGNDARSYAALAPMFENAAQMEGSWARQLGGMMQGLGGIGIMHGLAAPSGAGGGEAVAPDGQPWGDLASPYSPAEFTGPTATRGVAMPRSY